MAEMLYTVQSDDEEIRAIEVCVTVLSTLEPKVRGRVLRYLHSRAASMGEPTA